MAMYAQVVVTVLALLISGSFDTRRAQCYVNINQEMATTYPQCATQANAANSEPFEIILRDLICDPTCGPLYNATFYRLCPSPSISELLLVNYYMAQCRVNANGRACYSFYNDSDADMSVANSQALQMCSSSIQQSTCSDRCRDQLMAIKNYYGVCLNSVLNFTFFAPSTELLPLFSYQLWTNCGVPVPAIGGGDTVTTPSLSSAMASLKVAAMLAMLCAMLTIWIMQ